MPVRRELYLDHGRVFVQCPRLMSDVELADVLAAFVATVRAGPPKESVLHDERSRGAARERCQRSGLRSESRDSASSAIMTARTFPYGPPVYNMAPFRRTRLSFWERQDHYVQ
jgi:hypothetical protein